MNNFNKNLKIYIAGHKGMVGSACHRILKLNGYSNLIGKTSKELDLRNQDQVYNFIKTINPDIIINAAAKVGGILANKNYPYEFLIDNMLIQNNLIQSAHKLSVKKFIFLGSSCIYPKYAPQPLKEDYLLSDKLEETNKSYAIAKISGIMLIESLRKQFGRDYVSLMPTNLYGPNDNYDLKTSHVFPAMIKKFHDAKIKNAKFVTLWGSGKPKREFLHVDDLANAVLFFIKNKSSSHIYNIGTEKDISIEELANLISEIIGFKGYIKWDRSKPDGTPRKLLDCSRVKKTGWNYKIKLIEGIKSTYNSYLELNK